MATRQRTRYNPTKYAQRKYYARRVGDDFCVSIEFLFTTLTIHNLSTEIHLYALKHLSRRT